jgi:hypothetical protein
MHTKTKIHLSALEKELIENKEWILTKASVIEKVFQLFGGMHDIFRVMVEEKQYSLITGIFQKKEAKISKGENYLGLPYVIMDYPAFFSKESTVAIRTFFWWGNFFSISLHLSGKIFQIKDNFSGCYPYLKEHSFFICINDMEWQHDFGPSNYMEASKINEADLDQILKKNFFKIAKKIDLDKWEDAPEFLERNFSEILEFLKISFRGDGKVP